MGFESFGCNHIGRLAPDRLGQISAALVVALPNPTVRVEIISAWLPQIIEVGNYVSVHRASGAAGRARFRARVVLFDLQCLSRFLVLVNEDRVGIDLVLVVVVGEYEAVGNLESRTLIRAVSRVSTGPADEL